MVKRIRKRVQKDENTNPEESAVDAREEGQPLSFGEQLDELSGDGVTSAIASSVKVVAENRGVVITAAVLLIGSFVGVYFMQSNRDAGAAVAAAAFHDGAEAFEKVVAPESSDPKTPPKALEGEARSAQLTKAQKAFSATQTTYSTNAISTLAALGEAGTQLELGATDKALALYGKVTEAGGTELFVKAIAVQGQAVAHERKGDSKAALASWKTLEELNSAAFGLLAGMQQGRILESSGDLKGARDLYSKLKTAHSADLDKFAFRETKSRIERSLARLGTDAPAKK